MMKKNYTIKAVLVLMLTAFLSINANAQIRLTLVDPVSETITIHNYGGATVDVSAYRFCSLLTYRTINTQTTVQSGSLSLAPGADVVVTVTGAWLNDSAADLGLYLATGSFASTTIMVDFMQWGSGGNGRESVAVAKGIWTAGTFISVAAPYAYTGDGGQNGSPFWDTALGVEDFEANTKFSIYPNPTASILNIQVPLNFLEGNIEIFDILGKQIVNKPLSPNSLLQINVSNWDKGLYLIKVTVGKITQTKRFIKN